MTGALGVTAALTILAASAQVDDPCFEVGKDVSAAAATVVRAHQSLVPAEGSTRLIRIGRAPTPTIPGVEVERLLAAGQREFPFRFTIEGAIYTIAPLGAPAACRPFTFKVPDTRESTPPLGATAVLGMSDGFGIQYGAAAWIKRLGAAGSITPLVPGEGTHTFDIELAYRANRGIAGVGYRRRFGVPDDAHERIAYVHYSLELPGIRLWRTTWSTWIGLEIRPAGKSRNDESWEPIADVGVRLQLRLPRDRWLGS